MSGTQHEKDQFDAVYAAWKLADDNRRENLLRARNGEPYDFAQLDRERTHVDSLMRDLMEKAKPFLHPRK